MKRLLFAAPTTRFDRIFPRPVCERIAGLCDVIAAPVPAEVTKGFILEWVRDAQIVVTSWGTPGLDADIIAAAPRLELVAHAAGTVKPVMSEAAWNRGIRVASAARAIAPGVAEFCLALALTASKRVFWFAQGIQRGQWRETTDFFGPAFDIYRQNVGIIGASQVGRRLIELLKPFGCNILLYDPYCAAEEAMRLGATKAETLEDVFARCRVVSLNAPATRETEGMVRGRHFAMLSGGAVFINTSRGSLINQEEMTEELRKGRFIACLDVTWPEPLAKDHELRRLPNVLITPHIAGCINENLVRIGEFIAGELAAYIEGRPLVGEVKYEQLSMLA